MINAAFTPVELPGALAPIDSGRVTIEHGQCACRAANNRSFANSEHTPLRNKQNRHELHKIITSMVLFSVIVTIALMLAVAAGVKEVPAHDPNCDKATSMLMSTHTSVDTTHAYTHAVNTTPALH